MPERKHFFWGRCSLSRPYLYGLFIVGFFIVLPHKLFSTFGLLLVWSARTYVKFLSTGPWKTTYSQREEQQIKRGKLLTTIPLLKKEWKVSFDFKANNFVGLSQLLHMTVDGKGDKYGDRTPAIWTHPSKGVLVSSAVRGNPRFSRYFKALPSTGEWINIEVGQHLEGSGMIFSISIGGKKVFSTRNSKPSAFKDVQVFTSSRWYSPVNGFIKNLLIQNKNDGRLILSLFMFIRQYLFRYWRWLLIWLDFFILPSGRTLTKEEHPSCNPSYTHQGVESVLRIQPTKLQLQGICADPADDHRRQEW